MHSPRRPSNATLARATKAPMLASRANPRRPLALPGLCRARGCQRLSLVQGLVSSVETATPVLDRRAMKIHEGAQVRMLIGRCCPTSCGRRGEPGAATPQPPCERPQTDTRAQRCAPACVGADGGAKSAQTPGCDRSDPPSGGCRRAPARARTARRGPRDRTADRSDLFSLV